MIGTNQNESLLFSFFFSGVSTYDEAIAMMDGRMLGYNNRTITEALFEYYGSTEDEPGRGSYVNDALDTMNDMWICHVRSVVNHLANTDNVYYYNFDHIDPTVGG